ncbi:MAG: gamma-glutamylcyclotransferase [Deltaproteobacteria bacterium]|nr:gamma-glutamylcyclotransferase [Deltaproteobacteria bacterium]
MYYFAYGSNMDWPQMQRRCPSAQFVCVARLPAYRFAIARHSRLRHCGTANIYPKAGSDVWGVVYDVSDTDLIIMDGFEDGYARAFVDVYAINDGKAPRRALVYIAPKEEDVPLPNAEYKRLMVAGARHWQLPQDYQTMLQAIAAAAA